MIDAKTLAEILDSCESLEKAAEKLNEGWEYVPQEFKTEWISGTAYDRWVDYKAQATLEEAIDLLTRQVKTGTKYRVILRKVVFKAEGKVVLG